MCIDYFPSLYLLLSCYNAFCYTKMFIYQSLPFFCYFCISVCVLSFPHAIKASAIFVEVSHTHSGLSPELEFTVVYCEVRICLVFLVESQSLSTIYWNAHPSPFVCNSSHVCKFPYMPGSCPAVLSLSQSSNCPDHHNFMVSFALWQSTHPSCSSFSDLSQVFRDLTLPYEFQNLCDFIFHIKFCWCFN